MIDAVRKWLPGARLAAIDFHPLTCSLTLPFFLMRSLPAVTTETVEPTAFIPAASVEKPSVVLIGVRSSTLPLLVSVIVAPDCRALPDSGANAALSFTNAAAMLNVPDDDAVDVAPNASVAC